MINKVEPVISRKNANYTPRDNNLSFGTKYCLLTPNGFDLDIFRSFKPDNVKESLVAFKQSTFAGQVARGLKSIFSQMAQDELFPKGKQVAITLAPVNGKTGVYIYTKEDAQLLGKISKKANDKERNDVLSLAHSKENANNVLDIVNHREALLNVVKYIIKNDFRLSANEIKYVDPETAGKQIWIGDELLY